VGTVNGIVGLNQNPVSHNYKLINVFHHIVQNKLQKYEKNLSKRQKQPTNLSDHPK
jgi:hypothetical protein